MNIKVIGSGCENCDKTNAIVKECVEELGIDAEIERVADLVEIVKLGVMAAPSVMIDGKLVIAGQVPSKKQMMKVLKSKENCQYFRLFPRNVMAHYIILSVFSHLYSVGICYNIIE